jgi:hypothetical protein
MRIPVGAIAASAVLVSGCVSATVTDMRLTALSRRALPLSGQSQVQQVTDVSDCRERIMDGLVYVGAYTLYNPLVSRSAEQAIRRRELRLAGCLRELGYALGDDSAGPRE